MRTAATLLLVAVTCLCSAGYWGSVSSGVDMNYLDWEHGGHLSWGFMTAFGPRLFDDVYLRLKISNPTPFFILIGNQLTLGGEVVYYPINPRSGFALKTSLGASWCLMWPEHVIVILADGDTNDPPKQYSFDSAEGIRMEALVSIGCRFERMAFWLDLGLDHRMMEVDRFVHNEKITGDFDFTGVHFGFSIDVNF